MHIQQTIYATSRGVPEPKSNLSLFQPSRKTFIRSGRQARGSRNNGDNPGRSIIEAAVCVLLNRASRWAALYDEVGFIEVLLIDAYLPYLPGSMTIEKAITTGTETDFEECKQALLDPLNGLREDCIRLAQSGTARDVLILASLDCESESRAELAARFKTRLARLKGRLSFGNRFRSIRNRRSWR